MTGKKPIAQLLAVAGTFMACVLSVVPILLMISWALLPQREVFTLTGGMDRFAAATLENFASAIRDTSFVRRLLVSVAMASATSIALAALGLPAGFGSARLGTRRAGSVGFSFLGVRTLPAVAIAIPVFFLFNRSSIAPTWLSLGILHVALLLPVYVWLSIPVFASLPDRIDDVAVTSGCSRIRFLFVTAVPVLLARLSVVHLICFVLVWNETFFSATFQVATVTEAIPALISHHGYDWGTLMALGVLVDLPAIVVVAILFRFIGRTAHDQHRSYRPLPWN